MKNISGKLNVEMRDGRTFEDVEFDTSDAVSFELSEFYNVGGNGTFTTTYFYAYSAMHRAGKYKDSFDKFRKECVGVQVVKESDAEADPTQTDQSSVS